MQAPNAYSPSRRQVLLGGLGAAGAVALGLGSCPANAVQIGSANSAIGFDLPRPTGPLSIGSTELHLRQDGRPDPWVPDVSRELMVSVWYPALPGNRRRPTPYLQPVLADYYASNPPAGLSTKRIAWSQVETHAEPEAATLARPHGYPVVLYSPGGGNSRALGTILVEELVSHGYVVVTVDHTYETAVEFPGGRLEPSEIPANPPDLNAAKKLYMDAREADVVFVLDQVDVLANGGNPDVDGRAVPHGLGNALDTSRMGMFGHSAGGVTSARAVRDDRRLRAGINFDGFFEFGENHPELGEHQPFLLMGARSDPSYPPLLGKPRTHRTDPLWRVFWERCSSYRLDLNVPDGRHYTYTDLQWWLPQLAEPLGIARQDVISLIGTVDPARIIDAERAYVVAFFEQTLRGRPQPLLAGPAPWYPDVRFIW